jgi:hypothetical protein
VRRSCSSFPDEQIFSDAREHFRAMLQDVWTTARSEPDGPDVVLYLSGRNGSPSEFFRGDRGGLSCDPWCRGALVNGALNGLITAIGAVGGGWLCDRMVS